MLENTNKFIEKIKEQCKSDSMWNPVHYLGDRRSFVHGQCAGYKFEQRSGVNTYWITRKPDATNNKAEKYICVFSHEGETSVICNATDDSNGVCTSLRFELGKPVAYSGENPRLKYLILILYGRYASSFDRHAIDTTEASLNKKLVDMCKNKETKPEEIRALLCSNNINWAYLEALTAAMNAGSYECVDVMVEKWPVLKIRIVHENYKSYPNFAKFKKEEDEETGGLS
jgi:hypothetical protein